MSDDIFDDLEFRTQILHLAAGKRSLTQTYLDLDSRCIAL